MRIAWSGPLHRSFEASTLIGVIGNGPSFSSPEEKEVAGQPIESRRRGVVWSREAEELLESLKGVLSARVVAHPDGTVEEIHVLTTDVVAPKQTVRNVESALAAQYDLVLDHRKISVAQTTGRPEKRDRPTPARSAAGQQQAATELPLRQPAPEPVVEGPDVSGRTEPPALPERLRGPVSAPESQREPRLLLLGHSAESLRSRRLRMRVSLEWMGRRFQGEASAADLARARLEGFALATLRALEAALSPALSATEAQGSALSLDGVQLVEAFDRQFVLVAVNSLLGPSITLLTGAAAVDDSKDRAVILATLQAADRRVRAFLGGAGAGGSKGPESGEASPDPFDIWA